MRDRAILLVMARRANVTGEFFQSQARTAREAGCNVRTVRRATQSLLDNGLISRIPSNRPTDRFRVLDDFIPANKSGK
ncbi:helix-turn-helix domain-containing protein [Flavisphingopyxis soli]